MSDKPERASDTAKNLQPQPTMFPTDEQTPTTRITTPADQSNDRGGEAPATRKARTLTSSPAVTRKTPSASAPLTKELSVVRRTQAPTPLKPEAERNRALAAINAASDTATTVIPGARRYRRPARVVPRRVGPRSIFAQFAVSTIVTAILLSALALSTPLGQATGLDLNAAVTSYTGVAPWRPTPTPTLKPTATPSFRPPAGANPGQQAVINNIVAVFGSYSAGALAVAHCESGYDPNAWNSYPIMGSHASGVFQILYPSTWKSTSYASYSPFNADANIHAAYEIFKRDGYSWREWQCQP